jgi:hypothetical protein
MVLLTAPVSPGQAKDAFEALEIAYGGSSFTKDEAISMLQSALNASSKQAESLIAQLLTSGCIM